ncbi:hypothetical protein K505DRAFT_330045 [Melanomma pulvis-pyrius CBS 109.77]|uniref:F-box domain-containing protein n=1 Tax=Melanomma pulvis-pyrius CBS 109.77 TaxID=1314802 RepID=A0A6A6WS03_9PLEO|nr:hypothetical protein K505DRAFT_330045 [Melanomma pulvis-pyrius CBS 109.77]
MNNLPQELVDRISSYLSQNDLKNTLFLSREFQCAAEQYSGAFSDFALKEDNADTFLETYGARRFRYLRNLEFRTSVPALEWDDEADDLPPCRDTAEELQQIDQEFTRQIGFLFSTLKAVETRAGKIYGPGKIELTLYTPTRAVDRDSYCLHRIFTSWRVHLLSPETLPVLMSVQTLIVEHGVKIQYRDEPDPPLRKLDLRVLLDISNKMPNLNELRCNIGGDEWTPALTLEEMMYTAHDWEGPRRDTRHDFSKALVAAALPCLRHAQLNFIHPLSKADEIDQRRAMPNLVKPAIHDPFSSSLRLLSYQLRTMNLRVVADETLFWPTDGSTPSWPNLETVSVMFHMATPSGAWYFQGLPNIGATEGFDITDESYPPLTPTDNDTEADDETGDFEWDGNRVGAQYRVRPNNKTLVPFLTAFAKAAAQMPSLKEVALWSPLKFSASDVKEYEGHEDAEKDGAWGIAYNKPGIEAFSTNPGTDFSGARQIWWRVGKWRPDPELHDLFQQIGRGKHGEGLEEYWDEGEGLGPRDLFSRWDSHRWYLLP